MFFQPAAQVFSNTVANNKMKFSKRRQRGTTKVSIPAMTMRYYYYYYLSPYC